MRRFTCFALTFCLLGSCLVAPASAAIVIGDTVRAANTFQHPTFSGGLEAAFQLGSAVVVDPGLELPLFATIQDVDFGGNSLTMTFRDRDGLLVTDYPADTFDRYYFGFDGHTVDSISINPGGGAGLTAGLNVGLLAPGFVLPATDVFGLDLALPFALSNGGFFVEFGQGTTYTPATNGQSVSFSFTTSAVPEPSSALLLGGAAMGMALIRRRSKADSRKTLA